MFLRPASLDHALAALGEGGRIPLCGGTDIFPALVDRPRGSSFLDLSRLDILRSIHAEDTHWRIGAATTWSEIVKATLPPGFAMLQQAARQVGSIQIQNRATIGGNLCNASPAADGVPPLLALDAQVELASQAGRRRLPLGDFLLGNRKTARKTDEIVVALHIPRDMDEAGSAFIKLGARKYLVISIVMVAAAVRIEDGVVAAARIAVGSASVVAQRLGLLEQRLVGQLADINFADAIMDADLQNLSPIDDVRATAEYRRDAAREIIARTLQEAVNARPA